MGDGRIREVTLDEFHKILEKQGVNTEELRFICPQCKLVQTANDLIAAGAGKDLKEVEGFVAFSCVGRWTKDKGCDWTLGGLLQIHEFV